MAAIASSVHVLAHDEVYRVAVQMIEERGVVSGEVRFHQRPQVFSEPGTEWHPEAHLRAPGDALGYDVLERLSEHDFGREPAHLETVRKPRDELGSSMSRKGDRASRP